MIPIYPAKAEFFRTLGHPARIRILELLNERDHAVHELLARIDIEASNLSQQLAVLRRAGLVISATRGKRGRLRDQRARGPRPPAGRRRILLGLIADQDALGPQLDPSLTSAPGRSPDNVVSPAPELGTYILRRVLAVLPARRDLAAMRRQPRRDIVAGLTVAVVALPLALAFGIASGLGAGAGIVTAIVAGTVAALFGGSNLQVSGPTGAMTVVLVPIVATHGAAAVAIVGLLAGIVLVVLALVGAGRSIATCRSRSSRASRRDRRHHRHPAAPAALGVSPPAGEGVVLGAAGAIVEWLAAPATGSLLLAGSVAAAMILARRRLHPGVPVSLAAVAIATVGQPPCWASTPRIGVLPAWSPDPSLCLRFARG